MKFMIKFQKLHNDLDPHRPHLQGEHCQWQADAYSCGPTGAGPQLDRCGPVLDPAAAKLTIFHGAFDMFTRG